MGLAAKGAAEMTAPMPARHESDECCWSNDTAQKRGPFIARTRAALLSTASSNASMAGLCAEALIVTGLPCSRKHQTPINHRDTVP